MTRSLREFAEYSGALRQIQSAESGWAFPLDVAFVPLDPEYPADRIRFMLKDSRAAVLLTESAQAGRLPEVDAVVLSVDQPSPAVPGEGSVASGAAATASDIAYVIYTSGSTGRPKGVVVDHRGLMNYLGGIAADLLAAGPVSSLLHNSLSFDFSFTGLFLPLFTGGTLHLAPPLAPLEELARIIQDPRLSLVRLTPSHIGGEVLRARHVAALRRIFPETAVYNHYGPAEAVVGCCVMPLTDAAGFDLARYQPHEPLPIGRPLPGTDLFVAYRTEHEEASRTGELLIGGTGLARGYLGRPEETQRRFRLLEGTRERVYRSGDVVTIDKDGLLVVLGRTDDDPAHEDPADGAGGKNRPVLDAVCRIWARVLGLPAVLPEDNFLELGGDSIRAISVVRECRELGLAVTSRGILLAEDVAELVESIQPAPGSQVTELRSVI